jgi:hypothetical protein
MLTQCPRPFLPHADFGAPDCGGGLEGVIRERKRISSATNAALLFERLRPPICNERLMRWSFPSRCVPRCAPIAER